ncbi:MAG: nitroreductase [Bacteroidales bacterium]|jgi:nitroreductase|nr:nitroreductase [Bacteroidales bacterium]
MTLTEVINARSSVRKYKAEKPSRELINEVLNLARLAPSAVNKQPWHFYVVETVEKLEAVRAAYARDWFRTAPLVIVVTANHAQSWHRADGKDHADIDAAIVTDHITLAAVEKGLSTCWVCNFDVDIITKALNLTTGEEPVVLIPIGYADGNGDVRPKQRKSLEDLTTYI